MLCGRRFRAHSSRYAKDHNASLYEVTDDEIRFLGIISNETKMAVMITPGEHLFMVVSDNAEFMRADLLPDRTYYSYVKPGFGASRPKFTLWPLSTDSDAKFYRYHGIL